MSRCLLRAAKPLLPLKISISSASSSFLLECTSTSRTSIRTFSFSYPSSRRLGDIVKLPLLQRENREDVIKIWQKYYEMNLRSNGSYFLGEEYRRYKERATLCPFFIAPVSKKDGHFMLLMQIQNSNSIIFTALEAYKQSPSAAPPFFVITLYDEFLLSKNLVLLRGDILSADISSSDAKKLVDYFRCFYFDVLDDVSGGREGGFEWVKKFNRDAKSFNFTDFQLKYSDFFNNT